MTNYHRMCIEGTLTCETDLRVGSGDTTQTRDLITPDFLTDIEGETNTVCIGDQNGTSTPYIPGSSIRGAISAMLAESPLKNTLFGYERPPADDNPGERQAGRLRLSNAWLVQSPERSELPWLKALKNKGAYLDTSIKMNPVTRSAEDKKLFREQMIPTGSVFRVCINGDKLNDEDIKHIQGLLNLFTEHSPMLLGSGKSRGNGRLTWQHCNTTGLSTAVLTDWLASDTGSKPPMAELEFQPASKNLLPLSIQLNQLKFQLHIHMLAPLLSNEASFAPADAIFRTDKTRDGDPVLAYNRRNGKAILKGRSVAGVFRSRARQIVATLIHHHTPTIPLNQASETAQAIVDEVFGSDVRASVIGFGTAQDTCKTEPHSQTFTAIDRFTGGVADGQLVTVEAAICKTLTATQCYVNTHLAPASDWWKGLIALVVRDSIYGELTFGWGTAKGYGQANTSFTIATQSDGEQHIQKWSDVVDFCDNNFGAGALSAWLSLFHEHIAGVATQLDNGKTE